MCFPVSGTYPVRLWSIQISPSCSLSTTTSLQWPLTLLHMRKEGNAYAYWNSFKVRLSSILLYWFCLDRNRKYLNLTWVPVLLLCSLWCDSQVYNTSSSLKCFKLVIDGVFTLEYLSNCNSHKTWCPSAQTTTFQKVSNGEDKKTIMFLNFYEKYIL